MFFVQHNRYHVIVIVILLPKEHNQAVSREGLRQWGNRIFQYEVRARLRSRAGSFPLSNPTEPNRSCNMSAAIAFVLLLACSLIGTLFPLCLGSSFVLSSISLLLFELWICSFFGLLHLPFHTRMTTNVSLLSSSPCHQLVATQAQHNDIAKCIIAKCPL